MKEGKDFELKKEVFPNGTEKVTVIMKNATIKLNKGEKEVESNQKDNA